MRNRICDLLGIEFPVIQGGMVWCSGWELASAVSNAGGLGLIGSGSMYPDVLQAHIRKCKAATDKPFGVNVPLMYPQIEKIMEIIVEEGVKVVFTSAGNPKAWTSFLKENGITVVHVIANGKFAQKCEEAGVDAIVAEGFEAGGHNGKEETTTLCLIPHIRKITKLPLIAAGGIATGRSMLAAMALGAEGVQVGTTFALSAESSASEAFKFHCLNLPEGETKLSLKKVSPTRLVKNEFFKVVQDMENRGAAAEELRNLIGKGRARRGIFEGDLQEGMLEIGQGATLVNDILPVSEIVKNMVEEYNIALGELSRM